MRPGVKQNVLCNFYELLGDRKCSARNPVRGKTWRFYKKSKLQIQRNLSSRRYFLAYWFTKVQNHLPVKIHDSNSGKMDRQREQARSLFKKHLRKRRGQSQRIHIKFQEIRCKRTLILKQNTGELQMPNSLFFKEILNSSQAAVISIQQKSAII